MCCSTHVFHDDTVKCEFLKFLK